MANYLIHGMWGFGDNIYQRAFIQELAKQADVYLETPWPELYQDLNVKFVRGQRPLRTQMKNVCRQTAARWTHPPSSIYQMRISYALNGTSIPSDMQKCFPMLNAGFRPTLSLPAAEQWVSNRKLALVRPVTLRTEWFNAARNPLPEYVAEISAELCKTHHVIVIADLQDHQEYLVGEIPKGHEYFLKGELDTNRLLSLIQSADIIVGGVGWIVPAAIAAKRRAFIIQGGHGGHNAPERILLPEWQHQIGFATPDKYCRCVDMRHQCLKFISHLQGKFQSYLTNYPSVN